MVKRNGYAGLATRTQVVIMEKDNEKKFQGRVVYLAKLNGFEDIYHTTNSMYSPAGYPDLVMLKGKRMVVVELKMPKGSLTAEQYFWLEAYMKVTPDVYLWYPDDWEEMVEVLGG